MEQKLFLLLIGTIVLCHLAASYDLMPFSIIHLRRYQNVTGNRLSTNSGEWFDQQRLDHFDATNLATWKQRYFVNLTHFDFHNKSSPIFLCLGGESEAGDISEGTMLAQYAQYYRAGVVTLEHRYYGESHPVENLTTENLRFLTSEQALQDAATFVEFFKEKNQLPSTTKWIVFGGSYSGSLAAWFREKYPHLVSGAIASSAPVRAVVDFPEYYEVVQASFGPKCSSRIGAAFAELEKLLKNSAQWERIDELFKTCEPLQGSNQSDLYTFAYRIIVQIGSIVQNDPQGFVSIDTLCSMFNSTNQTSLLDTLAGIIHVLNHLDLPGMCFGYRNNQFIKELKEIDVRNTNRVWIYQTCSEFGYFQSTDSKAQPFGNLVPVDFYLQNCLNGFGSQFSQNFIENAVDFTDNYYGSTDLSVTNVLFTNGLIDPWHSLGVLQDRNPTAKALVIPGTSHCADMFMERKSDPQALKDARKVIQQTIGQFLEA